ncbi:MAG: hydroxypyruvate isomerase family protein [Limnobacter sp.]|nr:hydroxypyruvate isomerase family protein [Limnobacter sp.]
MPRFAANLSTMYTEFPFLQRFEAAAQDGFEAVECQFPYEQPAAEVAAALRGAGLKQVLINAPAGNAAAGERGIASLPGREAEFDAGLDRAIEYAQALDCPRVHLMAGLLADESNRARQHASYVANLRRAARRLEGHGITALIEPINPRDVPGYLVNTQAQGHAVLDEVGEPNLKVQMDLYHCQVVEGDLATKIRRYLPRVGHVQIAGLPGRHEPDVGEINYPFLFALLDELGYDGWIGCEYLPRAGTSAGLGWLSRAK